MRASRPQFVADNTGVELVLPMQISKMAFVLTYNTIRKKAENKRPGNMQVQRPGFCNSRIHQEEEDKEQNVSVYQMVKGLALLQHELLSKYNNNSKIDWLR